MKIALSAALRAFNATGSIIALAVFCVIGVLLLQGCTALKVTDYGHEVVRDSDGKPLVDKDGKVQTVTRTWWTSRLTTSSSRASRAT